MKATSSNIVNIILAVVILGSLFLVSISTSQMHPYDPWWDLNDDGVIDISDLARVSGAFGTYGTPINKTALLLELLTKVESLNTTIIEMQNTINYLNSTVIYLNETVTILNSTGFGAPDFDSGWVTLNIYYTSFAHNLGTTNLLVYIQGMAPSGYIHQYYYGGEYVYPSTGERIGAYWDQLSTTTVYIYREPNDSVWQKARVMIWKIPEP